MLAVFILMFVEFIFEELIIKKFKMNWVSKSIANFIMIIILSGLQLKLNICSTLFPSSFRKRKNEFGYMTSLYNIKIVSKNFCSPVTANVIGTHIFGLLD